MPGFDRSGPMGAGPMTGSRRGLSGHRRSAANWPAYGRDHGYGSGRGMGFRRGFGRGAGNRYGTSFGYGYPPASGVGYPLSRTDELKVLRANAGAMQESLEGVQRRIAELEKEGSE